MRRPFWRETESLLSIAFVGIQTIEEHLRELGCLETKRQVPGPLPVEYLKVRYVKDRGEGPFETVSLGG
jgi:hypothetical protein